MSAPIFEFRPDAAVEPAARTGPLLYRAGGKRLFDLAVLILMAPAAIMLIGVAAVAILLSGAAPFYAHVRVGRNGRTFRCWKLRTMVRDADAVLARVLASDPAMAREWARKQKLAADPRVTRIGRFLRRTSLDELPQLWNLALGQMSLVGPRPFTPEQAGLYGAGYRGEAYYSMRPGITGLWQVARRNQGGFSERVAFDRHYADRLSLATDLWILLRTVGVVLRATGQ